MATRIALIDDDPAFLALLDDLLSAEGYEPYPLPAGPDALPRLQALAPHAIVLDIHPARSDADWDVVALLRRAPALRAVPLLVCCPEAPDLPARAAALRANGGAVLSKPFDLGTLLDTLATLTGSPR